MSTSQVESESFFQRTASPCIDVTSFDDDVSVSRKTSCTYEPLRDNEDGRLLSTPAKRNYRSDSDFSDSRYFTASSGDELYDDDDDDEDDDGMCINLDCIDGNSLSGLHIDLKTLSAVSSMLAHYNPIIQSDNYGNPIFVAPPPPPYDEYYAEHSDDDEKQPSVDNATTTSSESTSSVENEAKRETDLAEEDFDSALQELDDAILQQDTGGLFSDAITELTDVMEKMANFISDPPPHPQPEQPVTTEYSGN